MSPDFQQKQTQSQTQYIAPQLRQSLKILQIPAHELRNAILEELQINPALEELPMEELSIDPKTKEPEEDFSDYQELEFQEQYDVLQKLDEDWKEYYSELSSSQTHTPEDAERRQHFFDSLVSETSMQEHLMEQAKLAGCEPNILTAISYLVGSLDDHGFLPAPLKDLAHLAEIPIDDLKEGLTILKTFEPLGIGCSDVQDCLIFQLEQKKEETSQLALSILKDHFALFLRRRVQDLAQKLSANVQQIEAALEVIKSLDPDPGRRFREDTNSSVSPDITIEKQGDDWQVVLNSDHIPRLRINKVYKELVAKETLTDQERDYIQDKMRSGKFLMSAIEQRQQTLERISRELLNYQIEFFEQGISALKPLTMNTIADKLGVHETTISRAIANKYVETPFGVFDLKYFFTTGFTSSDGTCISNTTIKDKIANIIESENPGKPYSDQKISEMLAKDKLQVARRTIAKYRDELGIPSTSLRRRY